MLRVKKLFLQAGLSLFLVTFAVYLFSSPVDLNRISIEHKVKAAYLYNIIKFVEWPKGSFPDPKATIQICLLGSDPIEQALQPVISKTVRGHSITVTRIKSVSENECHILFVSSVVRKRLKNILHDTSGKSVLTVSDMNGLVENGGMIGFTIHNANVRLIINLDMVKKSGFNMSAKLLAVAISVLGR